MISKKLSFWHLLLTLTVHETKNLVIIVFLFLYSFTLCMCFWATPGGITLTVEVTCDNVTSVWVETRVGLIKSSISNWLMKLNDWWLWLVKSCKYERHTTLAWDYFLDNDQVEGDMLNLLIICCDIITWDQLWWGHNKSRISPTGMLDTVFAEAHCCWVTILGPLRLHGLRMGPSLRLPHHLVGRCCRARALGG